MGSPFAPFANAVLNFKVPNGELVTNPKTGNVKPSETTIAVTALLKQAQPPRTEPLPGKDNDQIYYEGFVVSPSPLPDSITPEAECTATIDGLSGEFRMIYTQRNPYTNALGIHDVDRIRGYFKPDSFQVSP